MPIDPAELPLLIATGLVAGTLGGLLGIGGSVVMIPVLTLLLGRDQHLAQAAAMIANVCVAVPATIRHHRARSVPWPLVVRMIPASLIAILLGVAASNLMPATWLMRCFGFFLLWVVAVNVRKLIGAASRVADPASPPPTWTAAGLCGGIMGFAAGLLGIGGGIIAVPLLQRIARLPLRAAIGASAAAMCVSAPIGAWRKTVALPHVLGETTAQASWEAVTIAACLAPSAILGGLIGATLTHRLPLRWIRLVLVILLLIAGYRFLTA